VGQLLVLIGLTTLTYAVIDGTHDGWSSPLILGLFITSGASLTVFLLYEPRRRDALVDLRFFRSMPFSSATLLGLCAFASFAGFLFVNALYLQQVRGFSAFHTGLCTLPLAITMMLGSPLSGRLVATYGTRPSLLIAGGGFMLSTLILTGLTSHTPLALLLVAYALFGVGLAMVNPAISINAVAGMPLTQAGVAAAIASTSRQVGAALEVAVTGAILSASHTRHSNFTQATHPIWWIMTGCGGIVMLLAWAANTAWSHSSAEKVASLLESPAR
jgi:MFS family permease